MKPFECYIYVMSNGLDVALMKDPFVEWSAENGDRHTNISFGHDEWWSFFFVTLNPKSLDREIGVRYDDDFYLRDQQLFKQSLEDYPLLARIEEFYRDAAFAPAEITSLRDELIRTEQLTLDANARSFLNGMLNACELASSERMGIRLLSS